MIYRIVKARAGRDLYYVPQKRKSFLGIGYGKWEPVFPYPFHYLNSAFAAMDRKGINVLDIKLEI